MTITRETTVWQMRDEYLDANYFPPPSVMRAIEHRWLERVVPNGWERDGAYGGAEYLRRYGRSIGLEKCIAFAYYATERGYYDFAQSFWVRAHHLHMRRLGADIVHEPARVEMPEGTELPMEFFL